MDAQIAAVIPARGGSKGIARKNLIDLCGQPLIAYAIQSAKGSRTIDRVFVTTDDVEIAEVSRSLGAEVIERPTDISGDGSSSEAALIHAVHQMRNQFDCDPGIIVFLQCTAPLTTSDDIDGVVRKLRDNDADTALAVTHFHYFLWEEGSDGLACGINHEKNLPRVLRQDLQPQYVETGSVYAMRTDGFMAAGSRFFGSTVIHVVPQENWLEIDEPHDLEWARYSMRSRK